MSKRGLSLAEMLKGRVHGCVELKSKAGRCKLSTVHDKVRMEEKIFQ